MNRLLTKLRLRRKDRSEKKPLPKNLSQDVADDDNDYVLNIDRSISYECKRLSLSYTLLSDSPRPNNKRLRASASLGDLDSLSLDPNVRNNKTNRRKIWFISKPTVLQKKGFFSRFRLRSKKVPDSAQNEQDTKLHVLWYAASDAQNEEKNESRVQFRRSWDDDPKKESEQLHRQSQQSWSQRPRPDLYSFEIRTDSQFSLNLKEGKSFE